MDCPICKGNLRNVTVTRVAAEIVQYNAPGEQCEDCGEVFTGWRAGLAELRALKRASEQYPDKVRWTEKEDRWLARLTVKEHTDA